jgi:hypothetical protein
MNQQKLDMLDGEVKGAMQQYVSGMLGITEFCDFMALIRSRVGSDTKLCGLLDPNTGLRYPTLKEMSIQAAQHRQSQENLAS